MRFFAEYEPFFKSLTSSSLVLTPNQRLSRFVTAQYALWQQQRGVASWPSLNCQALQGWILNQWHVLQAAGHPPAQKSLLTPEQQRQIWIQVIAAHKDEHEILMEETLADLVSDAWGKLCLWRKSLRDLGEGETQVNLFKNWVTEFQNVCRARQVVDIHGLQAVVVDAVRQGVPLEVPTHCCCIGFDQFAPVENWLLESLEMRGASLSFTDVTLQSEACRVSVPDADGELAVAARWAAALLQQNPNVAIGIVVPRLSQQRAKVERIFGEIFEPQAILPENPRHATPFNVSATQPLAQAPMIASALDLLQVNRPLLERELVGRVMRSPFVAGQAEFAARARLEARLQQQFVRLSPDALYAEAAARSADGQALYPILHKQLSELRKVKASAHRRRYSDWAEVFAAQLQVFGWPGERALDTLEYQQLGSWTELLAQLANFDRIYSEASFSEAFNCLTRLAFQPFHAQTGDSPVQVLGLLEAAGQQFDYLWITGLDDRLWPEPCQPNPILPVALQRAWSMPRSSWERELEIAKKITARLLASAPVVRVSHAAADGDQMLRPSPLISHLPELHLEFIDQYESIDYYSGCEVSPLDSWLDEQAPRLPEESGPARGGSAILKDQAACPFKAFAKHRLGARDPEPLRAGVSPAMRGTLLHKTLELIWGKLQNQQALLRLDDQALGALLGDCLQSAWSDLPQTGQIGARQKQLEFERAHRLLNEWLTLERQRPPFDVVTQEALSTITVGPLRIRVRFDRVDRLADGQSLVVVDYKTGQAEIKSWAGTRPDEPQVPVYALALLEKVQAAAFAQISVHEVAVKGVGADPELWPCLQSPEQLQRLGLPSTWPELLSHWRQVLHVLAEDFAAGLASVDPKSSYATCRFCDLQPLCRIPNND